MLLRHAHLLMFSVLLPWRFHSKASRAVLFVDFLNLCPIHHHFLLLMKTLFLHGVLPQTVVGYSFWPKYSLEEAKPTLNKWLQLAVSRHVRNVSHFTFELRFSTSPIRKCIVFLTQARALACKKHTSLSKPSRGLEVQ